MSKFAYLVIGYHNIYNYLKNGANNTDYVFFCLKIIAYFNFIKSFLAMIYQKSFKKVEHIKYIV